MGDSVLRAMTDEGGFRVITARTTDTVRAAVEAQGGRGAVARSFGELLTGAILYRETMAPKLRVQAILQGAGKQGQLVADSLPDGTARGLIRNRNGTTRLALRGGVLKMMRTLPRGDVHQGIIEVPHSGSISDALMAYLQESEQVTSMISVGCLMRGDEILAAGGYIVQLLPELSEEMLMLMTARLEDFQTIDTLLDGVAATPDRLMDELLYGMAWTKLEESPQRFACGCSRVRVMTSLATLGPGDIADLVRSGETIEMSCDYCGAEYRVAPEELRGMLDAT
jgi:molecular chaperone Hsp33